MRSHNTKEIGTIEFIALVACIMLLTALAIDIMLPSFGELRLYFHLGPTSTATADIITFFFVGQIGQLAFGPLLDRYGRLWVLRIGFGLYYWLCRCDIAAQPERYFGGPFRSRPGSRRAER